MPHISNLHFVKSIKTALRKILYHFIFSHHQHINLYFADAHVHKMLIRALILNNIKILDREKSLKFWKQKFRVQKHILFFSLLRFRLNQLAIIPEQKKF
jgi:hypothetical protein